MNAGATLDEILRLPYLEPTYDEPEFVARNVWRLYGGWWDGDPARLHPPSDVALAIEVASHSGGAAALGARAREIADAGDLRLACQLVEWAASASPDDRAVRATRAELYGRRRREAKSLMAKGIYRSAARDSTPEAPI